MTEQDQDRSDQAVEGSLRSWAGSSDAPAGWVPSPPEAAPPPQQPAEAPTAVHVVESSGPPVAGDDQSAAGSSQAAAAAKLAAERPELLIAGAFIGGILLATILKRLAR